MPVQVRFEKSTPLYNVARDVAWNFASIAEEINKRIPAGAHWSALDRCLMSPECVTVEDMTDAGQAFANMIVQAVDTEHKGEPMQQLLDRSGWFTVPDAARIAYLALLGTVMMGVYVNGAREATLGEDGPCNNVQQLVASSLMLAQYARMTSFQRRCFKAKALLRRLWSWAK